MTDPRVRVLVAVADDGLIARLTEALVRETDSDVTVAGTLHEARGLIDEDSFDVVLAERGLPDGCGLALAEGTGGRSAPPLILLEESLEGPRILGAFRAGACDVLTPPYDLSHLTRVIQDVAAQFRRLERERARTRRLRRLSNRILRDRRELRRRVDLICRDLVHAYRRLAEKVVERPTLPADR